MPVGELAMMAVVATPWQISTWPTLPLPSLYHPGLDSNLEQADEAFDEELACCSALVAFATVAVEASATNAVWNTWIAFPTCRSCPNDAAAAQGRYS